MVTITHTVNIPESEIRLEASRSSGPGGQNVNKVNTRVTLVFDVVGSQVLTEQDKQRIIKKLGSRISRAGQIRVVSQRHRTQERNREAALEKFVTLLQSAFVRSKPRKKTGVPARAIKERLQEKKTRSRIKKLRSKNSIQEY